MSIVCGIYRITHRESGKVYVGQSRDVRRRWSEHRGDRSALYPIGRAIQKYGPDAFDFEVLEVCEPERLNERELSHIRREGSLSPGGYNLRAGGGQPDSVSEETRKKLSDGKKVLYKNPERRREQSESNRRAWANPELREAHSRRAKEQWSDPEKRERIKKGAGREEVREAKRNAAKALWERPEHREKMLLVLEKNRRKNG